MVDAAIYARVHAEVTSQFELRRFVFGPNTDLNDIARQIGDYEPVEDAMAWLNREFDLCAPGRVCSPDVLTITMLAEIAERGAWPTDWIR